MAADASVALGLGHPPEALTFALGDDTMDDMDEPLGSFGVVGVDEEVRVGLQLDFEVTLRVDVAARGLADGDGTVYENLRAAQTLRVMLEHEDMCGSAVEAVEELRCVGPLVGLLLRDECPELQQEAVRVLGHIIPRSAAARRAFVDNRAIPELVRLLNSPSEAVCGEAMRALANVAATGNVLRDKCLDVGVVAVLLDAHTDAMPVQTVRDTARLLSHLTQDQAAYEAVAPALPLLATLVDHDDTSVASDACWALVFLADGENAFERIARLLEVGVTARLVDLLQVDEPHLVAPALRTLRLVSGGTAEHTQAVIDSGALPFVKALLLASAGWRMRTECCALMGNVAGGAAEQADQLVGAGACGALVAAMRDSNGMVVVEAARALEKLTSHLLTWHIDALVDAQALPAFVDVLLTRKKKHGVVHACLAALENILLVGENVASATAGVNVYRAQLAECDVAKALKKLLSHELVDPFLYVGAAVMGTRPIYEFFAKDCARLLAKRLQ
eukprot:TRINITY_DN4593_c2_g1_i1.p1 TRINITY_DN4593_c2_g1~~TRINITY_DN4593_c2_g1_i1.p1  ORF type:complete len:573 (+),score=179.63 TRINITY_DN4593_c2_g1_i1:209-1720(+)